MQRIYNISLTKNFFSETVMLPQYDEEYQLVFKFVNNEYKSSFNGKSAYFEGTRSDGLSFRYSTVVSGNTAAFVIDRALTAINGEHKGQIVLYDDTGLRFGSSNVKILVEKAARPDNAVDADVTSQQTLLEQITSLAEQTEESADGIINMTVSAQTLAQGAEATVTKTVTEGAVNLHFGLPLAGGGTGGQDGYSPTVTITTITGGHRITITDKNGSHSADVMDGTNGSDGTTFTPSVSSAGVISWTNDGGKQNPSSVDLVAAIPTATTQAAGKMSATDKGRLDTLYADYSSALTALGVI